MSNTGKKVASIIGILIGVIVMIVGFVLPHSKTFSQASYPTTEIQQISTTTLHTTQLDTTPVGSNIGFGADFYTEIYNVSKDIGNAINNNTVIVGTAINNNTVQLGEAINNNTTQLGEAIDNNIRSTEKSAIYISEETARSTRIVRDMLGWLIVALGAIDVSVFIYLLVAACGSDQTVESIDYNLRAVVGQMRREAAERNMRDTAAEAAKNQASSKALQNTADQDIQETDKEAPAMTTPVKPKIVNTLAEKLEYALKFTTDDGMIRCLRSVDDEAVQAILNLPSNLVREQIEKLLASM